MTSRTSIPMPCCRAANVANGDLKKVGGKEEVKGGKDS